MVTIHDVADAAGVSISTVSRVMNQSPSVSKKTQKRVLEVIRKLGYVPNAAASKAAHKHNKYIGVLFPDISNQVFGRILQGINILKEKQVEGYIMASVTIPQDHLMWIHKNRRPLVYVCQDLPKFDLKVPASSVNMDNKQAICDMVHFLYHMGHRDIAFIGGPLSDPSAGKCRYDGYMKGMKECRLQIRQDIISFQEAFGILDGYQGMHEIYEHAMLLPTAVLCACDNMAVGAIDFMYDNSIQVPRQVSVTGVDDSSLAACIRPSLTTIRHATNDSGVKAAQLLLEYIANPDFGGAAFKTSYQLLRRQSVRQLMDGSK